MRNYRTGGGVVLLGDKSEVAIVGKGDTDLVGGVLHVTALCYGLISIGRLDSEGFITLFRHSRVWVVAPSGQLLCTGTC
jgi:hypothetical protein